MQTPGTGKSVVLSASSHGGEGNVIAAHWVLGNGKTADGTTITLPRKPQNVSVTITDGAGNTATTGVSVS